MNTAQFAITAAKSTVFNYGQTPIRTFTSKGVVLNDPLTEEPWFAASDVCAALGVKAHRHASIRIDSDEKGVLTVDTPGGPQQILVVNEAGLYSLILTSRKPEAHQFKRWVTHEVLPAIRRTGSYSTKNPLQPELALSPAALDGRYMIVMRDGHFESMQPVSPNHRGIDISNEKAVRSFLEEIVPLPMLASAVQAGVERLYRARRALTA